MTFTIQLSQQSTSSHLIQNLDKNAMKHSPWHRHDCGYFDWMVVLKHTHQWNHTKTTLFCTILCHQYVQISFCQKFHHTWELIRSQCACVCTGMRCPIKWDKFSHRPTPKWAGSKASHPRTTKDNTPTDRSPSVRRDFSNEFNKSCCRVPMSQIPNGSQNYQFPPKFCNSDWHSFAALLTVKAKIMWCRSSITLFGEDALLAWIYEPGPINNITVTMKTIRWEDPRVRTKLLRNKNISCPGIFQLVVSAKFPGRSITHNTTPLLFSKRKGFSLPHLPGPILIPGHSTGTRKKNHKCLVVG